MSSASRSPAALSCGGGCVQDERGLSHHPWLQSGCSGLIVGHGNLTHNRCCKTAWQTDSSDAGQLGVHMDPGQLGVHMDPGPPTCSMSDCSASMALLTSSFFSSTVRG
jgi:hypothetical protein